MATELFQEYKFSARTLATIEDANEIISEYIGAGYELTLRQLYYQFVSRGKLENTQRAYKRLSNVLSKGRVAGLIDWEGIVDRTRELDELNHYEDPEHIIQLTAGWYHLDKWEGQPYRPEVWIEKDALIGVIERPCRALDVPFFACKGYVSQSEQWAAGKRFADYLYRGQTPVVIHLGDHDPSGIDMTRDNADRLTMFADSERVIVDRRALNMEQVEEYDPPPNPAKLSDSRAPDYVSQYGNESWELDALPPDALRSIVSDAIADYIDDEIFEEIVDREREEKQTLREISSRYHEVVKILGG